MINPNCWLGCHGVLEHGDPMPPCQGQLIKAHLIPKQQLKRQGASWAIEDPRSWVWACGGIMGNGGHHGLLDQSRRLSIPYTALPLELRALAVEIKLEWWLRREYTTLPVEPRRAPRAVGER